jgi:nitrate reductase molybdenum cofactor assembly chaperone NarJ/NarW
MTEPAVLQAASLLLGHPDDEWPWLLDTVRGALAGLDVPGALLLTRFCDAVLDIPPLELSARYVATFEGSARRCLYLTHHSDGEAPGRGASLARMRASYLAQGWQPPEDELPDFLPLVLEFAARCPREGTGLLLEHRAAVEVLRYALASYLSPYADVLRAVCACLPGQGPACHDEALRLVRQGPRARAVGAPAAAYGSRGADGLSGGTV